MLPCRLNVASDLFKKSLEEHKCRRSLWHYSRCAWHVIDPSRFVDNFHVGALCEHFQAVTDGQIQKLIVNIPPGTAKSTIASVMWPSWEWVDHPGEQSLFGSYDIELAQRDSVKCRDIVLSSWYIDTFQPEWTLAKDQNAKRFYKNTLAGNRYTFGMLAGGKTGWRGNKVVLDDPNSIGHQHDPRIKRRTFDIFNTVLCSRVNNISKSSFVIIQQRMATDDMTGLLLEEDANDELRGLIDGGRHVDWVHLKLPMVATSRPCSTSIGWTDPRSEGQLLFPDLFPRHKLDEIRVYRLGENGWAGQYQQEPVPEGGARFKKSDFLHWYDLGRGAAKLVRRNHTEDVINLNTCWSFVTVDLAASEELRADYTVFSIWSVTKTFDLLLRDRVRERIEEPEIISKAVDIYSQRGYNDSRHVCFVVEDNGLGLPIVQAMRARGIPVLAVHIHRTDKYVRSATAAIRIEAGQIFWPDPRTPWYCDPRDGWEIEHLFFPNHAHDDQVDTTSLAAEAVYQACIFGEDGPSGVRRPEPHPADVIRGMGKGKKFDKMSDKFFRR